VQVDYVIGKYIRLSLDDSKTESMSIENQRIMLDKHIAGIDVADATILEFVDNGYSGTNFERPAVQELLELVREGKINCIIVKDMSRFGRNMIDTGYYVEHVFPLYRTRFISVCDCFDSSEYEGGIGGIDIALKFLVHEQYSRDLSSKIKAAKYEKAIRGESVRKDCLYGYKLNEARKMVIDEPAADTVRLIFKLALDGKGIKEIGRELYEDKRPTPNKHKGRDKNNGYIWTPSYIRSVLMEEQYTGTYIAGRTMSAAVGSKLTIAQPESKWIKIPEHHPAIIEKAMYEEVRKPKDKTGGQVSKRMAGISQRYETAGNPLKGKVVCGCCGHKMSLYSSKNTAFYCKFTIVAQDAECHQLKIPASELENTVMQSIREKSRSILSSMSDSLLCTETLSGYSEKIALIEERKCTLYENLVLGAIGKDIYILKKAEVDAELAQIKADKSIAEKNSMGKAANESLRQVALEAAKKKKLTQQLVDAMIDNVRVFPENRIEIVWRLN